MQTLVKLNLERNSIHDTGAKHLADALRHNTVRETSLLIHVTSMSVLPMQTLLTLNLDGNKITNMGAVDLAEALKSNTVG